MARAWSVVPQAVQFGRADIGRTEEVRRRYMKDAENAGGHLSLTVVLIKTLAGALKAFPAFNASVDPDAGEIIYKKYCNVGVAMDTDRGLVVPVIRDTERKNMIELAVALRELTDRARAGKLKAEEMQGGNITLTNPGAVGGDAPIPIVNWPEAAILGVGRHRMEAAFVDGDLKARPLLPLVLSYDHRLIDGADAVRFMNWIVEALEDPVKVAWEG